MSRVQTTAPVHLCALTLSALGVLSSACSTVDDRPAAWEYISPALFQPNCATSSCHSRATAAAGLDFSDPQRGYVSLTALWVWIVDPTGTTENNCRPLDGTVVCQRSHRPMVTPFDPAQSRVVNMLRARAAPRMPPDRPLPEADIQLVERWILDGASRTFGGDPVDAGRPDLATRETGDGAAADQATDGVSPGDAHADTTNTADGLVSDQVPGS